MIDEEYTFESVDIDAMLEVAAIEDRSPLTDLETYPEEADTTAELVPDWTLPSARGQLTTAAYDTTAYAVDDNVAAIVSHGSRLDGLDSDVSANTSTGSTNTGNISTNTSNISTNASDITDLDTRVTALEP